MLKVDVLNIEGKQIGDLELNENVFGADINEVAIHAALVNYLANQRHGTQSTKTRSEVSGGGRKPWRQKGTGRARQGSIRAPQWIKGGIALGPKPRKYTYAIPKKMRQVAIKSVLTSKVQEGNLIVVDKIALGEIKTKKMVEVLNNLNAEKALVIINEKDINVTASTKNIENAKAITVNTINIFDLLKYTKLVITTDAVKTLEEVYA
ncbi:MAG: 50S ribosomal protein L4 [Clostridia bacterium]|nr:50S ribosomal protein L4 [Clostridia bacterium]